MKQYPSFKLFLISRHITWTSLTSRLRYRNSNFSIFPVIFRFLSIQVNGRENEFAIWSLQRLDLLIYWSMSLSFESWLWAPSQLRNFINPSYLLWSVYLSIHLSWTTWSSPSTSWSSPLCRRKSSRTVNLKTFQLYCPNLSKTERNVQLFHRSFFSRSFFFFFPSIELYLIICSLPFLIDSVCDGFLFLYC